MSQKTALERIDDLEKKIQELDARSRAAHDFAEAGYKSGLGTNQSLAATAKTLTALISVLAEKQVMTGEEVLDGIRKIDENNTREEVADAVKAGNLRPLQVVHQGAVVVVKQVVIPKENPKPIVLAEYRAIELQSQFTPQKLREKFDGKKIGDTITTSSDTQDILTTVIEAYEIVTKSVAGENLNNEGDGTNGEGKEQQAGEAGTGQTA